MTAFKKAKDRKMLLNNPPVKETKLKHSRDVMDKYDPRNAHSKPGEFKAIPTHNQSSNPNLPAHLTASYNKVAS